MRDSTYRGNFITTKTILLDSLHQEVNVGAMYICISLKLWLPKWPFCLKKLFMQLVLSIILNVFEFCDVYGNVVINSPILLHAMHFWSNYGSYLTGFNLCASLLKSTRKFILSILWVLSMNSIFFRSNFSCIHFTQPEGIMVIYIQFYDTYGSY